MTSDEIIGAMTPSVPVMVRLSLAQAEAIDEWRRKQKDIPSRPEAIRRLVDLAINPPREAALKKVVAALAPKR
jgi:hypothetical protein